jgi:hypothetical protein
MPISNPLLGTRLDGGVFRISPITTAGYGIAGSVTTFSKLILIVELFPFVLLGTRPSARPERHASEWGSGNFGPSSFCDQVKGEVDGFATGRYVRLWSWLQVFVVLFCILFRVLEWFARLRFSVILTSLDGRSDEALEGAFVGVIAGLG